MKKRLFAGALALLMIIGLLPVSSMLKKPVEAQAASTTKSYKVKTDFSGDVSVGECIGDNQESNFFMVGVKSISTGSSKIKFSTTGEISFEIKGDGDISTITMAWDVKKNITNPAKEYVKIVDSNGDEVAQSSNTAGKNKTNTLAYTFTKGGKYTIKNVGDTTINITALEVTVPAYTITIKDPKATETSKEVVVGDGEEFTLNATTGDNFLYWETSYGRIISREPSKTLTAYYDETYTAVYATDVTVYYMTEYGHIYKRIAASDFNEDAVPDVPIRYGYNATGWSKDVDAINTDISEGTKAIYVNPVYSEDTTTTYKITVDTTAVGGSKANSVDRAINSVYTVSTDSSEFKCWKDADTNEVLSYNSTYSFFVNKDINIVAEAGTAAPEGVISLVLKDDGKADNKDSVVVFEYTVPAGSTVTFAGVYASPDKANLTEEKASYVDGGSFSSDQTYKYTITKRKGMATWYVKAVLEYTDSTGTHIITSEPVEF